MVYETLEGVVGTEESTYEGDATRPLKILIPRRSSGTGDARYFSDCTGESHVHCDEKQKKVPPLVELSPA